MSDEISDTLNEVPIQETKENGDDDINMGKAEDDFFAGGGFDDMWENDEENNESHHKKKKKKGKKKKHHAKLERIPNKDITDTNGKSASIVETESESFTRGSSMTTSAEPVYNKRHESSVDKMTPEIADDFISQITGSASDLSNINSFKEKSFTGSVVEDTKNGNKKHSSPKKRKTNNSLKSLVPEVDTEKLEIEKLTSFEDSFLKELEEINTRKHKLDIEEEETEENNKRQVPKSFLVNGRYLKPNRIFFEVNIKTALLGDQHEIFMRVKGSVQLQNLIETTIKHLEEKTGKKSPLPMNSIVFYVPSLNIVLNSILKISSILVSNTLSLIASGDGYSVDAILTSKSESESLQKAKRQLLKDTNENTISDDSIEFNIIDTDHKVTKIIHKTSAPLSELIDIYIAKNHYPEQLNVKILHDTNVLSNDLSLLQVQEKLNNTDILYSQFDKDELDKLIEIYGASNTTQGDIDNEDNDANDITFSSNDNENDNLVIRTSHSSKGDADSPIILDDDDSDNYEPHDQYPPRPQPPYLGSVKKEGGDKFNSHFVINLKGKDGISHKVKVNASTKICNLAKYYLEKSELPPETKIKLIFDDEQLNMNQTVGDTELEEGFLVDVII
ncbi:hypothetical protein B5S33_g1223 [[Candida] boidinii]|nr:hypothetical protein B5S30_g2912 [[Candida] boidinii]OWB82596.1 hypothetical protein B5S33_g1223 [[Candida] boidinii]